MSGKPKGLARFRKIVKKVIEVNRHRKKKAQEHSRNYPGPAAPNANDRRAGPSKFKAGKDFGSHTRVRNTQAM